jgi:hypothetical protein
MLILYKKEVILAPPQTPPPPAGEGGAYVHCSILRGVTAPPQSQVAFKVSTGLTPDALAVCIPIVNTAMNKVIKAADIK